MALLRQLLLLPLLAPLLAVLLVGAVNPRPAVRLQVLVWRTPALPIGVWMLLAGAGGGLLSAGATTLALRGTPPALRRQVRRPLEPSWQAPASGRPAGWVATEQTVAEQAATAGAPGPAEPAAASAGPSRAPGEPPPTVAVPYRVIRRSASTGTTTAAEPPPPTTGSRDTGTVAPGADASWDSSADQDW